MVPQVTLIVVTLAARTAGWLGWDYTDNWPASVAVGLAAMFLVTGIAHFAPPLRADMIAIVPPRLPNPGALVTLTGVLELVGAVGLLIPATRAAAAACLFVLLLAMFPANVHAARMANAPTSMKSPLGVRASVEVVFLACAAVVAVGRH
jgi:uncharacterized membrane protein